MPELTDGPLVAAWATYLGICAAVILWLYFAPNPESFPAWIRRLFHRHRWTYPPNSTRRECIKCGRSENLVCRRPQSRQ